MLHTDKRSIATCRRSEGGGHEHEKLVDRRMQGWPGFGWCASLLRETGDCLRIESAARVMI